MKSKSIRREPTYLTTTVWKALWLIAQAHGKKFDAQGFEQLRTADEMADELLGELIAEKYPEVLEHMKMVSAAEKSLIERMGKN